MRLALTLGALGLALMAAVSGCSNGGGYHGTADMPRPPANPGTIEGLIDTRWEAPGGTLTFLQPGQALFQPKVAGAGELRGSYTLDNGIATVVIIGVEPIAAVWDGVHLVIQGVQCTPLGKIDQTGNGGQPGT